MYLFFGLRIIRVNTGIYMYNNYGSSVNRCEFHNAMPVHRTPAVAASLARAVAT